MSLRDHTQTVKAGTFAKVVHNDSTMFYMKESSAPIPLLRVTYGGTRSGMALFKNITKGDKYTAPLGSMFTQIEIENPTPFDITFSMLTGSGDFEQSATTGDVAITGGSLDNIINPVAITNALDAGGASIPLQISAEPDTTLRTAIPETLAPGESRIVISARADRTLVIVQNVSALDAPVLIRQANRNTINAGLRLLPDETISLPNGASTTAQNIGTNVATLRIGQLVIV